MKDKILGLDLGITSVGWGIIDTDGNVIDCGVRLFDESTPDENVNRRTKRGQRRLKRRRSQRIIEMRRLLVTHGLIDKDFRSLDNPYHLRVKGLREPLSNEELATCILHIVKRRGSTLEVAEDDSDKDALKAKGAIAQNTSLLKEGKLHVCEVQLTRLLESGTVRGEQNIFKLSQYLDELTTLLDKQGVVGELKENIIKLVARKRHFSEGPGGPNSPSIYGRYRFQPDGSINQEPLNLIELMRGKCSIYPEKLRAPKHSFSAELHDFLNDLNNLTLQRDPSYVTVKEKQQLVEMIKKEGYIKPKSDQAKGIAKFLGLDESLITGFKRDASSDKRIITEFNGYMKLKKILDACEPDLLNQEKLLDKVMEVVTSTKIIEERIAEMIKLGIKQNTATQLASLTGVDKYHAFSLDAIYLLNEELLETNQNQMQIITSKSLKSKSEGNRLELDNDAILSPVAKRVHREAFKVVKALMKEHGSFKRIAVETTRDKNSKEQKDKIKVAQANNKKRRDNVMNIISNDDLSATEKLPPQTHMKVMLYQEQNGKCAYTNNPIDLNRLLTDAHAYEIDHIIPYSISFDDSFNNKVLCESSANGLKSNKTPFGYFQSGKAYGSNTSFEAFKTIVMANNNMSSKKKSYLLFMQDITKYDVMDQFINRNLIDTSYAIKTFMSTLKSYFSTNQIDTSVTTVKGSVTNLFRNIGAKEWRKHHRNQTETPLDKNRDVYMHHAIDALIVAGISSQKVFNSLLYENRKEELYNPETGEFASSPIEDSYLRRYMLKLADLDASKVKFSWKVDSKPNRKFSDETIYSTRKVDGEDYVVKKFKNIYEMKKDDAAKLFEDEKKYKNLLVFKHDPNTFELLKKAYEQYKHEKLPFAAFKAVHGPVRKYAKEGNGPQVVALKYVENRLGNHVNISNNYDLINKKVVLLQISSYRTDFYQEPTGEYKFVTIRYSDLLQNDGLTIIDEEMYKSKLVDKKISKKAKFLFSLYRNSVLRMKKVDKNGTIETISRFVATNNDVKNSIEVKSIHEKDSIPQVMISIGTKIKFVEKLHISPTGKVSKVSNEDLILKW